MIAFESTAASERTRFQQVKPHIGRLVEMLAGPDDLTADRGVLRAIRAGDGHHEMAAVVDFERNGRFKIPASLLFIPGCDNVVEETTAFILMRSSPHEREWMSVSFRATNDDVRNGARDARSACF
jgi:hypothetical protein